MFQFVIGNIYIYYAIPGRALHPVDAGRGLAASNRAVLIIADLIQDPIAEPVP